MVKLELTITLLYNIRMPDTEIAMLRKEFERELAKLRAEITELGEALKIECDSTTKHIKLIYRFVGTINEHLKPVVDKVFPGYAETKKQIDALVQGYGNSRNKRKRP